MRRVFNAALLIGLVIPHSGCATRGAAAASAPTTNRDFIARDEIDKGQWPNAYELIRSVRPQWLRVRGRDTIVGEPGTVQVVLDDVRLGATDALRTLPVGGIAYFQWLDGITASQRWGMGFGNGAIFVSTRPR